MWRVLPLHFLLLCWGFVSIAWLLTLPMEALANKTVKDVATDRDTCMNAADTMAIRACERLLVLEPKNLKILLRQSHHHAARRDYDAAIKIMKQAQQYHPDSTKVKHNLKKLYSYQKEQNWRKKRSKPSQKGTKEVEKSTELKIVRIKCLRFSGKTALDACNTAINKVKDDHLLYKARARALEKLGRHEDAAKDYLLASKYNPARADRSERVTKSREEKLEKQTTQQKPVVEVISQSKNKIKNKPEVVGTPEAQPEEITVAVSPKLKEPEQNEVEKTKTSVILASQNLDTQDENPTGNVTLQKIATLKELFDNSLISKEEYERRKAAVLDAVVTVPEKKQKPRALSIDPGILGNYFALVIGEQNYQYLPKLKTATRDAESVSEILKSLYGFKVKTLMDASRREILLALSEYREKLTKNDNLLIYYAGHGWLDEKADAGYWLPVEAVQENKVDWISMATLTASVRVLEAKHVMIVADSCFSGKLARGVFMQDRNPDYLRRIAKKRTRVVLTSGGLEPVLDGGGQGGHSVFAATFLQVLEENDEIMDGSTLFTKIRRPVMLKAQQVPEYSDIRMAGHEGGDFVFLPVERKAESHLQ